jgi:hypothetical protein
MLDRAGGRSLWFLTTDQVFGAAHLDSTSWRVNHGMTSVGSDVYMFGGTTGAGEEGLCGDGHRVGACQIERLGDAPRAAAVLVATSCARAGCHAVPHQGLVKLDCISPLPWHRGSQWMRRVSFTYREADGAPGSLAEDSIGM